MGERRSGPRLTVQTLKVLTTFRSSLDELAGVEIANATKLASGTLYPILMRLEEAGWLDSRWEEMQAEVLGRPRRRLYRLTALGAKSAHLEFQALRSLLGEVSWA